MVGWPNLEYFIKLVFINRRGKRVDARCAARAEQLRFDHGL